MLPTIIQGGMGVAISNWKLARTVSQLGQLGVVSGTGIARVFISRLMDGDMGGHVRRALEHFPFQESVKRLLDRYFIPGGKSKTDPYKSFPVYSLTPPKFLDELTAIASYVEVFLAKEGHTGVVGVNLLEKVQMPNLASLYGAMLAGVDYVLMGAGIPTQIAGILDKFARQAEASYRIEVQGALADDDYRIHFDPERIFPGIRQLLENLKRPAWLPIISSVVLAQALLKRSEGSVEGFVIEGPLAGGHNAPPRGVVKLNEKGEPIYTDKDEVDLDKIKQLGRPFWLAGTYGHPEQVRRAREAGAAGVQVGTAFALCEESGMRPDLRQSLLRAVLDESAEVFTDPRVSPTGFPFKVVQLEGTMSDPEIRAERPRRCDLGYLRSNIKQADGSVVYRCPAEPVDDYVRKGGQIEDTVGRSCLCNNLCATAGFPQHRREGYEEQPLITAGNDIVNAGQFLKPGQLTYTARDVIDYLLGGLTNKPLTPTAV